jgi:hypothetical protein
MGLPSLDGRIFRDVTADPVGDVGGETRFEYHQDQDLTVWARYAGGAVRLGHLVGTRTGDTLAFRYVHLISSGQSASGRCRSTIDELADGRLRLSEVWEWESKPGAGTSVLEEVDPEA